METKWANITVDIKGKQSSEIAARVVGARHSLLPKSSGLRSSFDKLGKRKRLDGCKIMCGPGKSLVKNYSNFVKSEPPKRILYMKNGEWRDFPESVVKVVRENFLLKNAAIEVELNGRHLLLDILFMIQLDLKTGSQNRIAWIDELGSCFFPEPSFGDRRTQRNGRTVSCAEPSVARDIKLQLEIELTGGNSYKMEECVEESNVNAKKMKCEEKAVKAVGAYEELEIYDNSLKKVEIPPTDEVTAGIKQTTATVADTSVAMNTVLNSDTVRSMFLSSLGSSICADILEIKHCSSHLNQVRFKLFQEQAEITKNNRGKPNVKYAWLPASKDAISSIVTHGFSGPKVTPPYGDGVHLASLNCAHISANYCDGDENGVRYIVLCLVILGNVELVHQGSEQCHPSTENFDSGVDDIHNPSQYIIWNMNMNSHIFPEYVVSFKILSNSKGSLIGKDSKIDPLGVTTTQRPNSLLHLDLSPIESGRNAPSGLRPEKISQEMTGSHCLRTSMPHTAMCLPFSRLFEALAKVVVPRDIHIVNHYFNLFRSKNICRDDFIAQLRSVVGDALLRSVITSLKCEVASKSESPLEVSK